MAPIKQSIDEVRDIDPELDEENKRHAETMKIMRKNKHRIKKLLLQTKEDHRTFCMLKDAVEKLTEKVMVHDRLLSEQEEITEQNLSSARRFQRELQAAKERADSSLPFIGFRHRTITTEPATVKHLFVPTTEETSISTNNL